MKEAQFVKLIKKNITLFNWMRIETTTMHGFPDLIGIAPQLDTVFIEAKVATGNKIRLSPHQIAMNIKLWRETGGCNYILVFKKKLKSQHAKAYLGEEIMLYEGRYSLDLSRNGVTEPPTREGWATICSFLEKVHGSRTTKSPETWDKSG
jgi:Holliday junction resolvase